MSAVMPEQADQECEAGWVNGNTPGSCISQSWELQKEMAGLTGLEQPGESCGEQPGAAASGRAQW